MHFIANILIPLLLPKFTGITVEMRFELNQGKGGICLWYRRPGCPWQQTRSAVELILRSTGFEAQRITNSSTACDL